LVLVHLEDFGLNLSPLKIRLSLMKRSQFITKTNMEINRFKRFQKNQKFLDFE